MSKEINRFNRMEPSLSIYPRVRKVLKIVNPNTREVLDLSGATREVLDLSGATTSDDRSHPVPDNACKDEESHECNICYESDGDDLIKTRCGHIFHRTCIFRWLTVGHEKTCPSCRTDMLPIVLEDALARLSNLFMTKFSSLVKGHMITFRLSRCCSPENDPVRTKALTRRGCSPVECYDDIKRFGLTFDTVLNVTVPFVNDAEREIIWDCMYGDKPWIKVSILSGNIVNLDVQIAGDASSPSPLFPQTYMSV